MSDASIPVGLGLLGISGVLVASGITGNSLGEILGGNFTRKQGDTSTGIAVSPISTDGGTGPSSLKSHPELKAGVSAVVAQILTQFPKLQITSTLRHGGGGSLHDSGRACDLAADSHYMLIAAAWIDKNLGSTLTEGIHNPNLSIKNGAHVSAPTFWGTDVWAGHSNHIHVGV